MFGIEDYTLTLFVLDLAVAGLVIAALISTIRMLRGPEEADRAIAGDLLMFGVVGIVALLGVRMANVYTFDLVLVAAVVGFLSAMSLARALTRGKR
ncbi:MAG: monovalent cation/H+ antiporter complex subunit F [Micrococcus sp.]|nr:monovalent cation/H+ antiporter complex subunit F [Micrococcus sp.]